MAAIYFCRITDKPAGRERERNISLSSSWLDFHLAQPCPHIIPPYNRTGNEGTALCTLPSCSAWSTLIGRGMSGLGSHWSRVLLAPALLCHKEPAKYPPSGILRSKAPSRRLWMRRAGSLWHKRDGASNSSEVSSTSRWTTLQ